MNTDATKYPTHFYEKIQQLNAKVNTLEADKESLLARVLRAEASKIPVVRLANGEAVVSITLDAEQAGQAYEGDTSIFDELQDDETLGEVGRQDFTVSAIYIVRVSGTVLAKDEDEAEALFNEEVDQWDIQYTGLSSLNDRVFNVESDDVEYDSADVYLS